MSLSPLDRDLAQQRLVAATEQMCLALQRASRSLYVRDAADFCCAIADRTGRFIAYPQGIGVSGFLGLDVSAAVQRVADREPLEPGDVIITNDPYASQGLSTHLPDVHVIAPYFDGDEIVGYGWSFVHVSDVGGRVPSSVSVKNDSIFAEGLRIPPVKYVRRGTIDPGVEALLLGNTRTPAANDGDLRAMLAALDTGRGRVQEVLAPHGQGALDEIGQYAREQTAARARKALSSLNDGVYTFEDYLDNDGVSEIPLRIKLTATVADGHLHLDFTGTDPQVEAALNVVTFGRAHTWVVTRLFALIGTLDPDIPLNTGLMDVVSMSAPVGTLLNPVEPAPVGVRHATTSRVNDVLSGALVQAAPDLIPAASSGLVVPVVFARNTAEGPSVHVVEPMVGGTGARSGSDGIDGRDSGISNLSNNPVEVVEAGVGVKVLAYRIRPDSGGAGRWRGGCGLELQFEALSHGSLLARGLERLRFRPWGVQGGLPGLAAELIVNEGTPDEERIRLIDTHPLQPGDRVTLRTSGAGGYGDPFLRDPQAVLADVVTGLVSREQARNLYGVAISDGQVDAGQTALLRAERPTNDGWGLGEDRLRWSRVFPAERLDEFADVLAALPPTERAAARRQVLTDVLTQLPEGFPAAQATGEQMDQAAARFVDLLS
ncbi:hydantoinase B/oxoprolinase family protein [Kineosporia babensis]|uniref:Hydantoinase B/oxoprolinase family protein n=1 Tax=Kineosporia babensis TaxID=499548 RepID=A0A9X1STH6_9ACTN|nr:hydantoinase B/oxoprolinase family protein [Kineosporia babensis]MCD5311832.1 hydantoinase B/oxoprolinase family protein [Kineosporia babensis]